MKTDLSQFITYKPKGKFTAVIYGEHISLLNFRMDEILKISNLVNQADIKTILKLYNIEETK